MKSTARQTPYNRKLIFVSVLLSLAAAYALASRAIDTGSLQQYALTLLCLGFAVWQVVRLVRFH